MAQDSEKIKDFILLDCVTGQIPADTDEILRKFIREHSFDVQVINMFGNNNEVINMDITNFRVVLLGKGSIFDQRRSAAICFYNKEEEGFVADKYALYNLMNDGIAYDHMKLIRSIKKVNP